MKKLFLCISLSFTFARASTPLGSPINRIELTKGGYLVLQVTDASKKIRKFLLTCEMSLPPSKQQALQISGVSYIPLKFKGYQSLLNHWLDPIVDNYIVCSETLPSQPASQLNTEEPKAEESK